VSELDNANGVTLGGNRIPALRTRWVDTAVEMRAGQTLALAGLIQTRIESQNRGLPWLSDLPWAGAAFRRVQEQQNEIELVIMVRPELVDALDPHEVPDCLPGQQTTSPRDAELYFRGYLEVPNCCPDGSCMKCQGGSAYPIDAGYPAGSVYGTEVPTTSGEEVMTPPANQSGRVVRPNYPVRQATRVTPQRRLSGQSRTHGEDPGLFGRVGYDDLD